MKTEIFREYDIRGVVEKDFDISDARDIGLGYGSLLKSQQGVKVVVGQDCRASSPAISCSLINGMIETGLKVIDLGICSTPAFYFALRYLRADGGIMVTASHNPPEYNGFKVCIGYDTIFGENIQKLRQIVQAKNFSYGEGDVEFFDILNAYCNYIIENIQLIRPISLAVDAGNGVGGITASPILKGLGCKTTELFFEPDGSFPNHEPDPTIPENLKTLVNTVINQGLELGIGFDGDADRLGVVDEKGNIIWGDMLMIILARDILKENPGAKFIGEVKCSQLMYDEIIKNGGLTFMGRTGHSLIKEQLKKENALLAGEMSGHIFFNHRYFGFDDAMYACCRLLEIISRTNKPLSEYLADLPKTYNTPEIRVECQEKIKFKLVELVKFELKKHHETIDIDGVRVKFEDGWGLVRASNTGPIIVLRFEAQSPTRLNEIQNYIEGIVHKNKVKLEKEGLLNG